MKDAQKPDHVSLMTLVEWLKEGRFVIPDFQREFEWRPQDINDLIRSIFLDYFIGSLLLWKGKKENFDSLACEPIYGFHGKGSPEHIVLDGQQRLTAMHYAFTAPNKPAPGRANRYLYFIRVDRFIEEAYDAAFDYDWTQTGVKTLETPVMQFERHRFPLAVLGKGGRDIVLWSISYQAHWKTKEAEALKAGNQVAADAAKQHVENAKLFDKHVEEITRQFQISYIELDRDLAIDKVCDIFTQINSKGIQLDVFDLINALLKPKGVQLKDLWRKSRQKLDFIETDRMNVYILQVMSILRQAYCSPKYLYYLLPGQKRKIREPNGALVEDVLIPDVAEFKKCWSEAVEALHRAIDTLRHPHEFGVGSSQYLPYVSILPAFAALQVAAASLPALHRLGAQRKIRQWYWASVFTNRYSGSVESTSARDFLDVKAWFLNDQPEPGLIGEFRERFRRLDLQKEIKRGTSIYNGIFNLFVLNGARDWMSGTVPLPHELDDHHIVPKSWGKTHNRANTIDSILNRTPLTAETNREIIGVSLPNEYLPKLIKKNGENTVRAMLESHFISPAALKILLRDPFGAEDFDAFITERQRTLQEAIENLLIKERLDLSPKLREMDAGVEAIELSLRQTIASAIDGNNSALPPHVSAKIEERLQAAAKKNAALDLKHYQKLGSKLEYADLRELQDTIQSKTAWPLFEARFANKESLAKRFDQLAELRNGIRHNRTVDEITRKDGEAAILWFQKVLK